jgi:hypothetical protein
MSNILQETMENLTRDFVLSQDPFLKSLEEMQTEAEQEQEVSVDKIKSIINNEGSIDEKVEEISELLSDIEDEEQEEKEDDIEEAVEIAEESCSINMIEFELMCLESQFAIKTTENLDSVTLEGFFDKIKEGFWKFVKMIKEFFGKLIQKVKIIIGKFVTEGYLKKIEEAKKAKSSSAGRLSYNEHSLLIELDKRNFNLINNGMDLNRYIIEMGFINSKFEEIVEDFKKMQDKVNSSGAAPFQSLGDLEEFEKFVNEIGNREFAQFGKTERTESTYKGALEMMYGTVTNMFHHVATTTGEFNDQCKFFEKGKELIDSFEKNIDFLLKSSAYLKNATYTGRTDADGLRETKVNEEGMNKEYNRMFTLMRKGLSSYQRGYMASHIIFFDYYKVAFTISKEILKMIKIETVK